MAEVLLVPPGAITAADRKALRAAGVVVVETDDPSKCQFVRSSETLSSNDMLWAAMDALRRDFDYGNKGEKQREQLAHNLFGLIAADFKQRKGRTLRIDAVDETHATCTVLTNYADWKQRGGVDSVGRTTRIMLRRFKPNSTGYRLVSDAPDVRDSRGRDARIHGLVLDESNPAPTLRELLRQWAQSGLTPPGSLVERTASVLEAVGPDGTCNTSGATR